MGLQFTPAAHRALQAASHWTSGSDSNGIAPPELLLGLLAEAESRAARLLAARGIDEAIVRGRWPGLQFNDEAPPERAATFSAPLEDALLSAIARLADYPPPLVLATEHLLLGLAATDHELSRWLVERGFVVDALEAEIHRLAGHQPNQPLPFDERVESKLPLPPGESRGEGDSAAAVHSTTTCPPSAYGDPLPRGERTMLLRIIDAAANRAREAMRVLEDDARFARDDRNRTGEFKYLRHALAAELARFSAAELLAARDTPADVGTQLTAAAERRRGDLAGVRTANFKRLQESLRSLEEFGKTFDAEFGAAMKQLRYRAYTLEQAAAVEVTRFESGGPGARPSLGRSLTGEGARASLGRSLTGEGARPSLGRSLTGEGARRSLRLAQAKLYVLVDGRATLAEFDALVRTLIAAGVDVLQLRDKRLNDRQLLERARRLAELTAPTNTLSIVNDRADLAALAGADGVHVGQEELSVAEAREIVGPAALVGVSTHSLAQARQAVCDGADYIGVGPTFASTTKQFDAERLTGLELLREVAAEIRLPAFAIGGIGRVNLHETLAAGCSRVAVSGAVLSAADPAAAAAELRNLLGAG